MIQQGSTTLIDHVLCSSVLWSVQAVGLSDHRIQIVKLNIDVQRHSLIGFNNLASVIGMILVTA